VRNILPAAALSAIAAAIVAHDLNHEAAAEVFGSIAFTVLLLAAFIPLPLTNPRRPRKGQG